MKKFNELKKETRAFSEKNRLKENKIYFSENILNNFRINEIFPVIRDIKPACQMTFSYDKLNQITKGLEELEKLYGLHYKISNCNYLVNSNTNFSEATAIKYPMKGRLSCSISKREELAVKSEEYFLKKFKKDNSALYSRKFGEIMGYPECCLDFGDKLSGNVGNKQMMEKNYVWSKAHIRSFMNSEDISRFLNIFTGHPTVSHVPCHLDCKKSKHYAKEILRELENENKNYVKLRKYFIFELDSLFWHYTDFILLKGEKNNNIIKYDDFLPVSFSSKKFFYVDQNFLIKFKNTVDLIKNGNKLEMKDDCFLVFKNNDKLGSVEKDYKFENILF